MAESSSANEGRRAMNRESTFLRSQKGAMVSIPYFGLEVERDDFDCNVCLVFSREKSVGGSVNGEEMIEDPMAEAQKIFVVTKNIENTQDACKKDLGACTRGAIKMSVYQKAVRGKLLKILQAHGFRAESKRSIDGDEVLLKLSMARGGEGIASFAHNHRYQMPVKASAYQGIKAEGLYYPGDTVPVNFNGEEVPVFLEYDMQMQSETGILEDFREVDQIRIIMAHLDNYVNVGELISQNIIARVTFPSNYDTMNCLYESWGNLKNCLSLPNYADDDLIRDVYGEQITFFFNWVAFFVRSLTVLGAGGLICFLVRRVPPITIALGINADMRQQLNIVYAAFAMVWVAQFADGFHRHTKRRVQRWGMEDPHMADGELPSYDASLEGSATLSWYNNLIKMAFAAFIIFFVMGVAIIEAYKKKILSEGKEDLYSAYMLVAFMKGGQFAWSKIAPKLCYLQNHRTISGWYNSLSFLLGAVNLFIALWPGIDTMFLEQFTESVCGGSKAEVLGKVYKTIPWPKNTNVTYNEATKTLTGDISWAEPFFMKHTSEVCMWGCVPQLCTYVGADQQLECLSDCFVEYRDALQTFFGVQIACTIAFILIPMVMMHFIIKSEISNATDASRPYSLLQFFDKRQDVAPYEYKSWGGSYQEDFTELFVAFATLTCFGSSISPIMSFIGCIAFAVIYRLYSFRMTLVTGRPFPAAQQGIGYWQEIFQTTCSVALVINSALIAFILQPFRDWPPDDQIFLFIGLETLSITIKSAMHSLFASAEPDDVRLSRYVNGHFKERMQGYATIAVPPEEMFDPSSAYEDMGLKKAAQPGQMGRGRVSVVDEAMFDKAQAMR
eukprot:TRINITY_DN32133_c0_g1_i1.p1 TRINITY_DN32133_c0_g1~~TRINITY_DN32133_c0_g1_i1.p1  ORF type:complete len:840 (-),score=242.64 TRINITY_DN32133_c0_g1_i1:40-2559(-)